ncbi:hypothetical protein G6F32_016436 [Rhizopus arrhizus]|nr:hypothetical protein G6F32_016436 [Rhizopus arrhizus]
MGWLPVISMTTTLAVSGAWVAAARKAALSIHASAWPPNRVPRWLVWLGKTISAMRTSVGGTVSGIGVMAVLRCGVPRF